jgi:hypothetical protein
MGISLLFSIVVVHFRPLVPDLDSETGSGSSDMIESGPNPDPRLCHRYTQVSFTFIMDRFILFRSPA